MPTLTDSVTPLQLSYYCLGYRLSAYRSCWGTKAYGSPNGTILLGYARAREQLEADLANAWKQDPIIALQKEVHAGYTGKVPPLTDSFYGGNFGGAGGNRTHA